MPFTTEHYTTKECSRWFCCFAHLYFHAGSLECLSDFGVFWKRNKQINDGFKRSSCLEALPCVAKANKRGQTGIFLSSRQRRKFQLVNFFQIKYLATHFSSWQPLNATLKSFQIFRYLNSLLYLQVSFHNDIKINYETCLSEQSKSSSKCGFLIIIKQDLQNSIMNQKRS